jgi:alanyl-tRNA synthetase
LNIRDLYKEHCQDVNFEEISSVAPYNNDTLFCIAGIQKWGNRHYYGWGARDEDQANIQTCFREDDLEKYWNDPERLLCFNMLGYFSFGSSTVEDMIRFWFEFLQKLGVKPDYATIHPDRSEWAELYKPFDIPVQITEECKWTDGHSEGYCTEWWINGIEVGNIVNPNDKYIDVGFGLERLDMVANGWKVDKEQHLAESIVTLINSGFLPGPNKQGSVLRRLILEAIKREVALPGGYNEILENEKERRNEALRNARKFYKRHKEKDDAWWIDTYGISKTEIEDLINNDN